MGANNDQFKRALMPRGGGIGHRLAYAAPDLLEVPWTEERDAVGGSGHIHWTIQAYQSRNRETGGMDDVLTVEVEAANETEAIWRAMEIIQRNAYRVTSVRESCTLDPTVREAKDPRDAEQASQAANHG